MDIEHDFADESVETSAGSIHVKMHNGSGRSMVFLHGLGSSTRTWTPLVPFLRPEFTICLVDLLGHGESDAPQISYDVELQVKVLGEIMKTTELSLPCLFGHSYGGWVAAKYALANRVERLILEDSAGVESPLKLKRGNPQEIEAAEKALLKNPILSGADQHVIKSIIENEIDGRELLTREELSMLNVPTLVIWGENDDVLDPAQADELSGWIKGSKLAVIKNAGHTPHYTFPLEVARVLESFLKEPASTSP